MISLNYTTFHDVFTKLLEKRNPALHTLSCIGNLKTRAVISKLYDRTRICDFCLYNVMTNLIKN